MIVLAVASGKGGVGKSTTAATFAALWAERGERVLVVDGDAQGSATSWLGAGPGDVTLLDVLTGSATLAAAVSPSAWPNVDILPASPILSTAERATAGQPLAALGLRRALAAGGPWSHVIADCPPSLSLVATASIAAASAVLGCVEASPLGIAGLSNLLDLVAGIGANVSPAPVVIGVLPCRVPARQRLAAAMLETIAETWPGLVLGPVRESVRAREAAAMRQPLTIWDPSGGIVADYRAALADVERRMQDG